MITSTLSKVLTFLFLKTLSSFYQLECNCPEQESLQIDIQNAALLFVGQPIEINETNHQREVIFTVEELWKGEINVKLSVITSVDLCDWVFHPDEKYLVFAYKDSNGNYKTDKCSRTSDISENNKDFNYIKKTLGILPEERMNHCSYGNLADKFVICSRIYSPICGCNGETYDNACAAYGDGVTKSYSGACK